jgi:hypothetical protein
VQIGHPAEETIFFLQDCAMCSTAWSTGNGWPRPIPSILAASSRVPKIPVWHLRSITPATLHTSAVDASTGQSLPELVVMKFDGTQWLGVGPNNGLISPPNAQNALGNYAMALDSTGKPVVEWNVNTGTAGTSQPAYVVRYQDSPTPAWVGVGSASGLLPSPSGLDSCDFILAPTLALDAHDQPILAAGLFMSSGSKIATLAAYQFDGSKWLVSDQHSATQAGEVVPAVPFTQSSNIGLTHNAANQVVVAWTEIPDSTTGFLRYYVQTWTGTAWQGLGGSDGLVDNPASPRLDRTLRLAQDTQGNYSIASPAVALMRQLRIRYI